MGERTFVMSDTTIQKRYLSLPQGSCEALIGYDSVAELGSELKIVVGRPQKLVCIQDTSVPEHLGDFLEKDLIAAGFSLHTLHLDAQQKTPTWDNAQALFDYLLAHGITQDDLLLACGDYETLSLVQNVASMWGGGCMYASLPTTLDACILSVATPCGLSYKQKTDALCFVPQPSFFVADTHLIFHECDKYTQQTKLGYVHMIQTAIAASKQDTEDLTNACVHMQQDEKTWQADQLSESMAARCLIRSSSSIAQRQALRYGNLFAQALHACDTSLTWAACFAEGMRFSARLAYAKGFDVLDLIEMQDKLFELCGIACVQADLKPDELICAMKSYAFAHGNRFMFALPQDFGCIRLASVEDDTLFEHVQAWCQARKNISR